jgi:hypothetical protein
LGNWCEPPAIEGEFRLECSGAIVTEVVRVLRLKFEWPEEDTNRVEKLIATLADPIQSTPSWKIPPARWMRGAITSLVGTSTY